MNIKIGASVGDKTSCANKGTDVDKIDRLLRDDGMYYEEEWGITGLFRKVTLAMADDPTIERRIRAIKTFQRIWKLPETGRVEPDDATLEKLNRTKRKLRLTRVKHGARDKLGKRKKIGTGAYLISFTPEPPPPPYQVWLGYSTAPGDYIDITGCDSQDVMTATNLAGLLKIIEKRHMWGGELDLRLFVFKNGAVISQSDSKRLPCPAVPHNGKLLPLDEKNNGDSLKYLGFQSKDPNVKSEFEGRWLQKVEGFDGYFFAYFFDDTDDSGFELKNEKRGFDCITYAGSVCGAPPSKIGATSRLIDHLKPTECSCETTVPASPGKAATTATIKLEKAAVKDVTTFFEKNATGYYFMWDPHHVVLVANGVVHEFAYSKKGYKSTAVAEWLKGRGAQSVRQLTKKPDRAV